MSLQPGQRVRCLFGQGVVESVDAKNNKVVIKFNNGETKWMNPGEVEKVITTGPVESKTTVTTTTTVTTNGVSNVVKQESKTLR